VGFLGAVTGGGGLLLGRDVATGAWSAPCAVGAAGLSIGAQVGGALNERLPTYWTACTACTSCTAYAYYTACTY